jgi:EF hand
MSEYVVYKSALVFSILVGMVVVDCGPLAAPTFAQRPMRDNDDDDERGADERRGGDEGRGRRGGRGGWGRRGGDEGERRERQRDESNDEKRNDENRDDERGSRNEGYARQLVKMHDKNDDMMLQEEERAKLTGPAARADLDDDKVITVEEITQQLNRESTERGGRDRRPGRERAEGASDRTAGKSESTAKKQRVYTSVTAGKISGKEKEAEKRRSYRFTPATERLTANLPSWFKSRDRNKDGQVSMSEYSRSWTDRLARQYRELDLNDDGVITSKEAAE